MNRPEFYIVGARLQYWLALTVAAFIGAVVLVGHIANAIATAMAGAA